MLIYLQHTENTVLLEVIYLKLDKHKINVLMAQKNIGRTELAAAYGCTANRISAILNCTNVRPTTAAKLSKCLNVDVTEILADE